MPEKEEFEIADVKEAMVFIFSMILIGAIAGSALHFYPFPVNGSVLIEKDK